MKHFLFFTIILSGFNAFAQKESVFVLDTTCIHPILNSIGNKNIREADGRILNPGIDEEVMNDDSFRLLFHVDTISLKEFEKLKSKFTSGLDRDTNLVEWTDTSFIVPTGKSGIRCRADKRDYSGFDYYIGYLKSLQLFVISSVEAKQETGVLMIIDKVSGKIFYIESPSDYPLESIDISYDEKLLSTFVNDHYSNQSFISLFEISKNGKYYSLIEFRGFYILNSGIKELIWISENEFALLMNRIAEDKSEDKIICIKVKLL